jgi:hypothetical protein
VPLLRVKEIGIHGRQIKLYSVDGGLWVSDQRLLEEFQQRLLREKIVCRKLVDTYVRKSPVATVDFDFWP